MLHGQWKRFLETRSLGFRVTMTIFGLFLAGFALAGLVLAGIHLAVLIWFVIFLAGLALAGAALVDAALPDPVLAGLCWMVPVGLSLFLAAPASAQSISAVQLDDFVAADTVCKDQLGYALDRSGQLLLAGAPGRNVIAPGAAYLFDISGGPGQWTEVKKLTPPDELSDLDYFGASVSIDGDVAAVGAVFADTDVVADTGAVYHLPLYPGSYLRASRPSLHHTGDRRPE